MALAAMAFSAVSASATTVTTEPGGVACPALTATAGGCVLHASGEVLLQGHVFGIESTASDCNLELTGRVDSTGAGKVDKAVFSHHAGLTDCTRTPCLLPWTATLTGSKGAFVVTSTFCVLNGTTQQTCTVALPVNESGHTYGSSFHVTATANTNAPNCEVEGQLNLEGTALELN
jgi:hypothetical protein